MAKKKKDLKIVRPARITEAAHKAVWELCDIYAEEAGLPKVSVTDAISKAIFEAIAKRKEAELPETVAA